jgi:cytochrome o ubiquinol oxidase operon protein cyoD
MNDEIVAQGQAPGVTEHSHSPRSYLIGLFYAIILTLASFWASSTDLVYAPGIPLLLAVLAIAQMGLSGFFLHISRRTRPNQ